MNFLKSLWEMLTHNADGTASSTKFWQLVANVCATWIMVHLTIGGDMSGEYLLIYMGALTAHRAFQTYMVNKTKVAEAHRSEAEYDTRMPYDARMPMRRTHDVESGD